MRAMTWWSNSTNYTRISSRVSENLTEEPDIDVEQYVPFQQLKRWHITNLFYSHSLEDLSASKSQANVSKKD